MNISTLFLHLNFNAVKNIFVPLFILLSVPVFAQNNNSGTPLSENQIESKLVALAVQNAQVKITDLQIAAAKAGVHLAKASWWNIVSLYGNVNEFSIDPSKAPTNIYYPKYNLGANIPFGIFATRSNNVKIARRQVDIAKQEKEEEIQEIKTDVLTAWQDYQMYKQQLALQSTVTNNEFNASQQAEQKFKGGQITIEDYNDALKKYSTELSSKISLQHDMNIAKLNIEKIIKVPLETVLNSH